MPLALRLDDARTQLISLAGIDGKVAANGRHSTTNLNFALNREYRQLRTRVCKLGYTQFMLTSTAAPIPGRLAGEDFIDVALPSASAEVIDIDVQVNGGWKSLDAIHWSQRRDVLRNIPASTLSAFVVPPPGGVGYWAIRQAPLPSGSTITDGRIALWPYGLTGNYKIDSVAAWADITVDANVFMLYEGWDVWLLNKTAMAIVGSRDGNKRQTYDSCFRDWQYADNAIHASAPRLQRQGHISRSPYMGINL